MTHNVIQRFREYLCLKTVQPDPDYESCIKYLQQVEIAIL